MPEIISDSELTTAIRIANINITLEQARSSTTLMLPLKNIVLSKRTTQHSPQPRDIKKLAAGDFETEEQGEKHEP